jgi:hypothetical protein
MIRLPTPNKLSTDRSLSVATQALFFLGRTGTSPFERKVWTKVKFAATLHCPVSTQRMLSKNTAPMGTKAKPLSVGALAVLLFVAQGKRHEVF